MTEIEHIFLDLDGTLIGSTGDVKQSVWDAIEPLRERFGLSVCTGRPRAGVAQRVARQLDPDGLHIFENGGMISGADGVPTQVATLDMMELATMAAAASRLDATLEFYTTDGIFVSRLDDDCREHAAAIEIEVEQASLARIAATHSVIRAHWIMREHVVDDVLAIPLLTAEIGIASSPVLPGMIFGSVTKKGVSKGSAAADLVARTGSSLATSVGIGDAVGDLPLLEVVGHPFVVKNAPVELRQRFEVLGDVDEDGVESLLRRLV